MNHLSLIDAIESRKSVKEFDSSVKIPRQEMEEMIALATKAPSSINLQPWRFVIVESAESKAAIKDLVRFNTRQLETSAAFILVLSDNEHPKFAEEILRKNVEEGHMPEAVMEQNLPFIQQMVASVPAQALNLQGMMDANLAAMQLMLVAKDYGYDTNPIGGFEREAVMDALSIDKERYTPVMFIAIGKGIKAPHGSSRYEINEIIAYNNGDADGIIGK